ncbi:protein phosphatase [Azospirillum sp. B510]|uniref:dual specificity protein phosphatase family protein n=1 Tax=Azospirillum sp. (strain B510) TaxID=137722 RepID=UPI0001C4C22D|nr:dual specificity protein phosphatase family protein [Azospirillum sp. B510]BAI70860.1 protein phosphatase [Azospirillum sp. B510]
MIVTPRTSTSHPLEIATVVVPNGGAVGFSMCPGRKDADPVNGGWNRNIDLDLAHITQWGATMAIGLLEAREVRCLGVGCIPNLAERAGIDFLWRPISDGGVPEDDDPQWSHIAERARGHLGHGGRVLFFCRAGRSRSAMSAACLLIDLGMHADDAIAAVRAARPGALQSAEQVGYVHRMVDDLAHV